MIKSKIIIIYIIVLVIITVLVHFNGYHKKFLSTPNHLVIENSYLNSLKNIPMIFNPKSNLYKTNILDSYKPIYTLSLTIDKLIYGSDVRGYFATNLLIHIIVVILLFYFLIITQKIESNPAFIIAAIFSIHPLTTANINFINNRSVLLLGMFYLLTLILYFYAYFNRKRVLYFLSFLTVLFAILSKNDAFTLPIIIILLHHYFESYRFDRIKKWVLLVLPHIIIIITIISINFIYLNKNAERVLIHIPKIIDKAHSLQYQNVWTRFYTMMVIMVKYFKLILYPVKLNIDYWIRLRYVFDKEIFYSLLITVLPLAISIVSFIKRQRWAYFILWYYICLIPYYNIKILKQMMSDSYLYLSMIGIIAAVSMPVYAMICRVKNRIFRFLLIGCIGIIIIILSIRTIIRNNDFKNVKTLWLKTVSDYPSPRAYYNIAGIFMDRENIDKAITYHSLAYKLDNSYYPSLLSLAQLYAFRNDFKNALFFVNEYNKYVVKSDIKSLIILADIFNRIGDFTQTEKYYKKILQKQVDYNIGNVLLGKLYFKKFALQHKKRFLKKAFDYFNDAHQNDTSVNNPHYLIALEYEKIGNNNQSIKWLKKSIRHHPKDYYAHIRIANKYVDINKFNTALLYYQNVISEDTSNVVVYIFLGRMYQKMKLYDTAVTVFKKAIEIDPDNAAVYYNAANLFVLMKDYPSAIEYYRKAIDKKPDYLAAYYSLANLMIVLDRSHEAANIFKFIVKNYNDNEIVEQSKERLKKLMPLTYSWDN